MKSSFARAGQVTNHAQLRNFETMFRPDDLETILAELEAGIVPTTFFINNMNNEKNSFSGLSADDARKKKRKWRKLKRKLQVDKEVSLRKAAQIVRVFLRKKAEKEYFND